MQFLSRFRLATLTALAVLCATAAQAGVADSPVPSISPTLSTRVVYIVPGIIKNNGFETAIICTSLDTTGITHRLALEVFDPDTGEPINDVSAGVADGTQDIPPGGTVTIATGATVGLHEDEAIAAVTNVKNGAGRILSTTTRLLCTAMVVEDTASPPATAVSLKVFARRKQNGD